MKSQEESWNIISKTEKIKVLIPQTVFNETDYLCSKISSVEWSGVLFYKYNGSIKDIDNFSIELVGILPLDRGNTTSTHYTFDERFIEYIEKNPHLEDCKIGHRVLCPMSRN